MSPEQIELVKSTWTKLVPISEMAAVLFYNKLFEIDPATRLLFKSGDLAEQRRKLILALNVIVHGLDHLDDLVTKVQDLGKRHAQYGVQDRHYGSVGIALLDTLEKGLGDAWTSDVAAAWTAAYTLLSDVMRRATSARQMDLTNAYPY